MDADQNTIPPDSFVTCSGDDTVRLWNYGDTNSLPDFGGLRKNPFSKELMKIVYVDSNYGNLCDIESLANAGIGVETMSALGAGAAPGSSFVSIGSVSGSSSVASTPSTATAPPLPPDNRGVRCVTVSPDCKHLCCGSRSGKINVYDMSNFEVLVQVVAHDGEILALEYTRNMDGPILLASGGRDRAVHVINADEDYKIHQTFENDHSSSVTALKFASRLPIPGTGNGSDSQMLLMSCSADKSILIRSADVTVQDNGHGCGSICFG